MDILKYFKDVNAQKQINRLVKKYKNKKIVIYGAGEYFNILNENYDLSKLNIVGIADRKFGLTKDANKTKYLPLAPEELKEFDFDIIMVALYDDIAILDYLEYNLLIGTKNENKKVISIIEPNLWYLIKLFILEK